jgi:hypothetical protein
MRKLLLLLLKLGFSVNLLAQWNFSSTTNTAISTGPNKISSNPSIVGDGQGGYFIAWMQTNEGVYGTDIYAQHIDSRGRKLWKETGVVICNASLNQFWPQIESDGSGGAIIVWQDCRTGFSNFDIYAQRITRDGNILWAVNGIPLTVSLASDLGPQMISDGLGGVIVAFWRSDAGGLATDVYAQRINGSGQTLWGVDGIVICNAINRQDIPKIVPDGMGGAIISWQDYRNSPTRDVPDVYVQRIGADGVARWTANGVPVCTALRDQTYVQLAGDKNGGAFLVWTDFRNTVGTTNVTNIFAQRISANGTALWAQDGIAVARLQNRQMFPNVMTCENGEVIISWVQLIENSIKVQKLSQNGAFLWPEDGVVVCRGGFTSNTPSFLLNDGNNGVLIAWEDFRNGMDKNIYAQHLSSDGNARWQLNGVAICNAPKDQHFDEGNAQVKNGGMISDGSGGAVLVWQDERANSSGSETDIYISRMSDPPPVPLVFNISDQCKSGEDAKGKLSNPPSFTASVLITQDGQPLTFASEDSSFLYFKNSQTTVGTHTVTVQYSNFAGTTKKDTAYVVKAPQNPSITISGNTEVDRGATTTLTAAILDGGVSPSYQWQDSTDGSSWKSIPGATSASFEYAPKHNSSKLRCTYSLHTGCTHTTVASNVLTISLTPEPGVSFRYFPNPVKDWLTIDHLQASDEWEYLEVMEMNGRPPVLSKNIKGQATVNLWVAHLPSGLYTVGLTRKQGRPQYFKVLIQ